MGIKTSQNSFWVSFFKWFVPFQLKQHFAEIKVVSNYSYSDKPVLLIANHSSWWDGWIAFYVSHFILKKSFHFMMLERELNLRKVLYKIGGFSIDPQKKSPLASLRKAAELLKKPNNLVLIYPQGKLYSQHTDHFEFQKGVELLTDKLLHEIEYDLVMMYFTTEYFERKTPGAYIYIDQVVKEMSNLQARFQSFASSCIQQHKLIRI